MEFSREFTRSDRAAQCLAIQDNSFYNSGQRAPRYVRILSLGRPQTSTPAGFQSQSSMELACWPVFSTLTSFRSASMYVGVGCPGD